MDQKSNYTHMSHDRPAARSYSASPREMEPMKYLLAFLISVLGLYVTQPDQATAQEHAVSCIHYHRGTQGADVSVFHN